MEETSRRGTGRLYRESDFCAMKRADITGNNMVQHLLFYIKNDTTESSFHSCAR